MLNFISFLCGVIFSFGLGMSGMTNPQKVIAFLDITGDWQPTLIFVMLGAIGFHSISYYFIRKRKEPFFEEKFQLPTQKDIDGRLVFGSVIFGLGWGIGGYCPGPALASLGGFLESSLIFTLAMVLGTLIGRKFNSRQLLENPQIR